MRSYRTAMALAVLLLLPTWSSADPAEEQAIKQADKPPQSRIRSTIVRRAATGRFGRSTRSRESR